MKSLVRRESHAQFCGNNGARFPCLTRIGANFQKYQSMGFNKSNVSEDEVINNSKLEHLYNHEFDKGRFFQVVFEDEKEAWFKLAPKTLMKVIYLKDQDNIEGIEIVKSVSGEDKQRISFSKFNFQQLKSFLNFISSIDLKSISDKRIVLADDSLDVLDNSTKKKIATLLA